MKIILSQVFVLLMAISCPSAQKKTTVEKTQTKESTTELQANDEDESEGKVTEEYVSFDGYNGSGYSFSYTEEESNNDEESESLIFEEVSDDILAKYDLKSGTYKGKTFKVKYLVDETEDETENGEKITVVSITLLDIQLIEDEDEDEE